eukprot:1145181-Pelagomonas_calceolata.AAC.1
MSERNTVLNVTFVPPVPPFLSQSSLARQHGDRLVTFSQTVRLISLWLVHASQQQIQKLRHKMEKLLIALQVEFVNSLDTNLVFKLNLKHTAPHTDT